jgi:O-antigen/teichoic acid export membrane protein
MHRATKQRATKPLQDPHFPARPRLVSVLHRLAGWLLESDVSLATLASGLIRVAVTALLLANTVVLGRLLGPEGFGIYSLVFALVGFTALPLNFGLSTLALRDVSALSARKQWNELTGFIRFALLVVVLYAAVVALLAATAWPLFAWHTSPILLATLSIGLILLPFHAAGEVLGAVLRALGRVVTGQLPDLLLKQALLLALLAIVVATLGSTWLTPSRALTLLLAAAVLATMLAVLVLARSTPLVTWHGGTMLPLRDGLRRWLPLALLGIMQGANLHTDVLMLGLLADPTAVGVYRVAAQCSLLVAFNIAVFGPVIGPHVARLHARGDKAAVQRLVGWAARCIFAAACPVFIVLVLFGTSILGFFGSDYQAGAAALAILATGQLVNASTGAAGLVLNVTGHERDTMLAVAVAAVTTVVGSLILVPPLGLLGSAMATALSLTLSNVILLQRLYMRTGLVSFAFPLPLRSAS